MSDYKQKKEWTKRVLSDKCNLGKNSLDEYEKEPDIRINRVVAHFSHRQQIRRSKERKKRRHRRQNGWDGKVRKEFVSRHLLMCQTKQNNVNVIKWVQQSSNKYIKNV